MKKSTILAVSLVLAAAILAVWFVREQPDSEQANSPVADSKEPSLPSVNPELADDSVAEPELERPTAPVAAIGEVEVESPTELFGEPASFNTTEYLNARAQSTALISAFQEEVPVTRTRILQANKDSVSRFVANVLRASSQFDEPVEIKLFPDVVCNLSSVEHVNQTVVPGDLRIITRCDSRPNSYVNIRFNSAMETLTFSINDGNVSYELAPLGATGFSLAMQMDFSSLPNRDF